MFSNPGSAIDFRHIFITLTGLMGIPNSLRILNKTSFLTELWTFLKSVNSWCTASLYSHFFSSIWWMQNTWPVFDLLRWNRHWFPIISSAYGVHLDSRMLVKILYVVDKLIRLYNYCNLFHRPSYDQVQWSTPSTAAIPHYSK